MGEKDCNCGKTREVTVKPPEDAVVGAAEPTGGRSLLQSLIRAGDVLGASFARLSNSELVDALVDTLTACREEKKVLATEVDRLAAALDECQDELSDAYSNDGELYNDEDDVETDDTEGDMTNDAQTLHTTTNVSGPTLSTALQRKATASSSVVRQDSPVQQHERAELDQLRSGRDGGMRGAQQPAGLHVDDSVPGGGPSDSVPVLHEHHQLRAHQQFSIGEFFPGPHHTDANIRGPVFQGYRGGADSGRVRQQRDAPLATVVSKQLSRTVARQHSEAALHSERNAESSTGGRGLRHPGR